MNIQSIQQIPFFQSLPEDELASLTRQLKMRSLMPGELLFRENDPSDCFTVILEGQVEVIKALETPGQRRLAIIGPGEYLGEMSLFYQNLRRSASARALTQVSILEIGRADLEALLRRNPVLAYPIMQTMSQRLRTTDEATIRDLLEKNAQLEQAYRDLKAAQDQLIQKEKLEHELKVARRIQESILPKEIPCLPGWEMAAHWQPAHAVSGDFYDFIHFPDGRLALIVGDVTGKGVPAALVMATTRAILRATAQPGLNPGQVLERVNDQVCVDILPGMFVTCFYGILDSGTGALNFANAGHCLPLQVHQSEVVEPRATGMPLGLLEGMAYEEKAISLQDGDTLLLYSDGLIEAHNPQREMFDLPRVKTLLSSFTCGPEIIGMLLSELAQFTGPDAEQEDDVTLVMIQKVLE